MRCFYCDEAPCSFTQCCHKPICAPCLCGVHTLSRHPCASCGSIGPGLDAGITLTWRPQVKRFAAGIVTLSQAVGPIVHLRGNGSATSPGFSGSLVWRPQNQPPSSPPLALSGGAGSSKSSSSLGSATSGAGGGARSATAVSGSVPKN